MKCLMCGRKFMAGTLVIPIQRYVVNEKRGDFVGNASDLYAHMSCVVGATT